MSDKTITVTLTKDQVQTIKKMAAYVGFPVQMISQIIDYVTNAVPVSGFLKAILSNNLMETVRAADSENLTRIVEYTKFFYSHMPRGCWGSEEKYYRWIEDVNIIIHNR